MLVICRFTIPEGFTLLETIRGASNELDESMHLGRARRTDLSMRGMRGMRGVRKVRGIGEMRGARRWSRVRLACATPAAIDPAQ